MEIQWEEREVKLLPTNQHMKDSHVWHVEDSAQLQTISFDEPVMNKN